jgi:hypothetical protein
LQILPSHSTTSLTVAITGSGDTVNVISELLRLLSIKLHDGGANVTLSGSPDGADDTQRFGLKLVAADEAPKNVTPPSIRGESRIGATLSLEPGAWTGFPVPTLSYQWISDGSVITGATATTYMPRPADDNRDIACRVSATSSAGAAIATTAGHRITYAPPRALGNLFDEVFDQNTGAQLVSAAQAFAGENLRFAVAGAGATINPNTGVVSISTASPISGQPITVTATNSGGSAQATFRVTVEAEAPGIIDDMFENPTHPDGAWRMPMERMRTKTYSSATEVHRLHIGYSIWTGTETPIYRARATDRLVNVYFAETWSNLASGTWAKWGNSVAQENSIRAAWSSRFPYPYHTYVTVRANSTGSQLILPSSYQRRLDPPTLPLRVRCPAGVTTQENPDSPIAIWQPDGSVFEAYGVIVMNNGDLCCQTYNFTDPKRGGDGWQNGTRASMIPLYAGSIRVHEWRAALAAHAMPNGPAKTAAYEAAIPHAIAIFAPAGIMANSAVHPALTVDRGALRESPPYSGTNPMGARFALPPSHSIAGMNLWSGLGIAVGYAMRKYGLIIADRGGPGLTLMTEKGIDFKYDYGFQQDLERLRSSLQKVTNISGPFVSG